MFRLTVSLAVVLGLGAIAGGLWAPAALVASPDAAEDPVADWNNRWERTFKDAAKEYGTLAEKYEQKLEFTSAFTRWKILQYLPEDPKTRAFLGYVKAKQADGKEAWERNDIVHDKLLELADLDDPKATKYSKELGEIDKKVATWFKGLALKATENGAAKGASADAKWSEKSARAWEQVLLVDDSAGNKLAEDAHKALGHPQYEKKYVSPFKLKFLKVRADRKTAGQKAHDLAVKPCDPCEPDGKFVSAGLTGGGAKTTNMTVNASAGKDLALRLAADSERSLNDLVTTYGYPDEVKGRLIVKKINIVKDADEYRKFLVKGDGWNDAKVNKQLDAHFGNVEIPPEFVVTSVGGADSDDNAMNATARWATLAAQNIARADVGNTGKAVTDGVEDWLWQSICTDVTNRVLGTKLTLWGAFGKYGERVEGRPGEDKWVELARRLVQTDDDIPLAKLPKLKINDQDFKGPQTIKGWAFLQFVFEKDPELAKKFIWHALANGTRAAVAAIYPDNPDAADVDKSVEKLDEEYRQWILKGW